jgi:transposase
MSKAAGEVGKSGRRKRRSWTLEEKRRIVDESLEDGASIAEIAEIARLYELNANQFFTWRRQFGLEPATASYVTTLLPVTIAPEGEVETGSGVVGQMEIVLAGGVRIIVWADVQTGALTRVLKALARS